MSQFNPDSIVKTLSEFDVLIRKAIEDGNLEMYKKREPEIRSFYKIGLKLSEPSQVAAMATPLYLHAFLRDYRTKKDSPSFLEDQRRRVALYNEKHNLDQYTAKRSVPAVPHNPVSPKSLIPPPPTLAPPVEVMPNTAASVVTAASGVTAAGAGTAVSAHAAASSVTAAIPVNTTTTLKSLPATGRQIPPITPSSYAPLPPPEKLGSGPITPIMAYASTSRLGAIRRPRSTQDEMDVDSDASMPRSHNPEPAEQEKPRPRPIERKRKRSGSEERWKPRSRKGKDKMEDVTVKRKMKTTKETIPVKKRARIHADVESPPNAELDDVPRSKRLAGRSVEKGNEKERQFKRKRPVSESSSSDSDFVGTESESEDHSKPRPSTSTSKTVIRSCPRPPVSPIPPTLNKRRAPPVPTGDFYDPPCSTCRTAGKDCERQATAGACVNCRHFKHKCEFAKIRKTKKSKPVVESEDDDSAAAPRRPRKAAEAAKLAISETAKPRSTNSRNQTTIPEQESVDAAGQEILAKILKLLEDSDKMTKQRKRDDDLLPKVWERLEVLSGWIDEASAAPLAPTPVAPPSGPIVDNLTVVQAFGTLKSAVDQLISLNLKIFERLDRLERRFEQISDSEPKPSSSSSSSLSYVESSVRSPSPPIPPPNVNLIEPTPDNSQKDELPVTQLHPTPPDNSSVCQTVAPPTDQIIPAADDNQTTVSPAATASHLPSTAALVSVPVASPSASGTVEGDTDSPMDVSVPAIQPLPLTSEVVSPDAPIPLQSSDCPSPGPAARTRSRSPLPSLAVPEVSPRRTRSGSRSRSPTPRPGSKRLPHTQ